MDETEQTQQEAMDYARRRVALVERAVELATGSVAQMKKRLDGLQGTAAGSPRRKLADRVSRLTDDAATLRVHVEKLLANARGSGPTTGEAP